MYIPKKYSRTHDQIILVIKAMNGTAVLLCSQITSILVTSLDEWGYYRALSARHSYLHTRGFSYKAQIAPRRNAFEVAMESEDSMALLIA